MIIDVKFKCKYYKKVYIDKLVCMMKNFKELYVSTVERKKTQMKEKILNYCESQSVM